MQVASTIIRGLNRIKELLLLRRLTHCLIAFLLSITAVEAKDNIQMSGYASFVGGRVIAGDEFLADYPKAAVYDKDWSFSPDTTLGLQFLIDIERNLELVVQAIANGATGYDADLDWAYLNYTFDSEISIHIGRKRLPLYYYSDFFDLGYAYHWIRPPSDNYTWQISNYNGISAQYQPFLGKWDVLIGGYTGREDSEDNDLLGLLSGVSVDETWKNMAGMFIEASYDWLDLRATYMRGQLSRTVNGVVAERNVNQIFSGISINVRFETYQIFTEFNRYERPDSDIEVDTGMVSLAYQYRQITPHVTRSYLKQKDNSSGGDEEHNTVSIGVRWDIGNDYALKLQYDKVEDKAVVVPVLGDSESVSIGIEVVF